MEIRVLSKGACSLQKVQTKSVHVLLLTVRMGPNYCSASVSNFL